MKNQKNDVIKFAKDFAVALNPYTNVFQKIELYDYQKKLLKTFEKEKYTIIKQSRQVGIDLTAAIYIAYYIMKNSKKTILVISENFDGSVNFLEKVRKILLHATENLYIDSKENISINNLKKIELNNGSKVFALPANENSLRGIDHVDLLFINNLEYIKNANDIWASLGIPLCMTNGKAILSSTPKYKKEFFHSLWTNAIKKENGFKPINVSWNQNPHFGNEWYEKMCRNFNYDKNTIKTELDGKFISRKDKKKKSAINIRVDQEDKQRILDRMKQKKISSITDYIIELINNDLK